MSNWNDLDDAGDDLIPLGDSLNVVLRALGPAAAPAAGAATVNVFRSWEEAVGAAVAEHARPIALEDGRLLVEVDQPGWATQLRFLSTTLLARLGEVVGPSVVRSIEVRVARR